MKQIIIFAGIFICLMLNADPYEIREVLRQAVRSRRINNKMTGVECVKNNDGTGAVIISAEAYRFKKQPNGAQSIDELVAYLQVEAQASRTRKRKRI